MDMSIAPGASRLWLINFYKEQLFKFKKLGLGRRTEFDVIVTEDLVKLTENRLNKLAIVYDSCVSDQAAYQRRMRHKAKMKMKGQQNGTSNTNGATVKPGK